MGGSEHRHLAGMKKAHPSFKHYHLDQDGATGVESQKEAGQDDAVRRGMPNRRRPGGTGQNGDETYG
jgi:hypothetical protein